MDTFQRTPFRLPEKQFFFQKMKIGMQKNERLADQLYPTVITECKDIRIFYNK